MKLFHIQADDPMGESLDWFVVAADPQQAVSLWETFTEDNGFDNSEGVVRVRLILDNAHSIGGLHGGARVIEWDTFPVVLEP